MSGKYVPPSRRPGFVPKAADQPPPGPRRPYQSSARAGHPTYTITEIQAIFGHPQNHTLTFFSFDDPPPAKQYNTTPYDPAGTPLSIALPPSPPPPPPAHPLNHLVSYVSIFPFAHPAWETKKELWTHTGAESIIEDFNGGQKSCGRPIPVFHFVRKTSNEMTFEGWWVIDGIVVVEPHSNELTEMLKTKEEARAYARNGRTSEAWRSSLSQRWIRLHLSPAPTTSEHYTTLQDPMSLSKGQGERYLLEIGGLTDEIGIAELAAADKQAKVEKDVEIARVRRAKRLEELERGCANLAVEY